MCATPSKLELLQVSSIAFRADSLAMLAAPAFSNTYRPIFLEYRGEWALIAFFATMSPTLGQTNFLYVPLLQELSNNEQLAFPHPRNFVGVVFG